MNLKAKEHLAHLVKTAQLRRGSDSDFVTSLKNVLSSPAVTDPSPARKEQPALRVYGQPKRIKLPPLPRKLEPVFSPDFFMRLSAEMEASGLAHSHQFWKELKTLKVLSSKMPEVPLWRIKLD